MDLSPTALTWIVGSVSCALLLWLARRGWAALHPGRGERAGFGGVGDRVRRLHPPEAPGVVVEIDAGWPGRTRMRVAAPVALPLAGPARLSPRSLRRGRDLSVAFGDLVWSGKGADDVARWTELLQEPLRALWGWRDRYTLQATLTPYGLLIHMPLVAAEPNEEPFLLRQALALHAALAAMAAETGVEGIQFTAPVTEPDGECSACWETAPVRDAVHCPACGARQHRECWEWTGGCGRFACDGVDKLDHSVRAARR